MPKHVPTFKHLLHTSQTPRAEPQSRERSVNELLSSSRQSKLRELPPHISAGGSEGGERTWSPALPGGSGESGHGGVVGPGAGVGGLLNVEDGGVHPAELLRRMNLSNWRASRSVAGPAPPPSWRPSSSSNSSTGHNTNAGTSESKASSSGKRDQAVSSSQLANSSRLFALHAADSHTSSIPVGNKGHPLRTSLVEHCFRVVLKHLEDETIVYDPEDDSDDREAVADADGKGKARADLQNDGNSARVSATSAHTDKSHRTEISISEVYTLGRLLREQVPYLTAQLKSALLRQASLLPSSNPSRLSDRSILAILSDPPPDNQAEEHLHSLENHCSTRTDGISAYGESDSDDWDAPDTLDSSVLISDLPLTLHTSPHTILRQIPITGSITSLNLAYSALHPDLERLVAVLPPGLRELGLVGVKFGGEGKLTTRRAANGRGALDEDALRKAFGSLGRKLIVLKMIDLSYPRFDLTPRIIASLLQPANVKLPSLRVLGLRGYAHRHSDNLDLDNDSGNPRTALDHDDEGGPHPFDDLISSGSASRIRADTLHSTGTAGLITTGCRREHVSVQADQMHGLERSAKNVREEEIKARKEVLDIVRSGGRKYVHVVW
ncbi:hypothetical protein IAU59_002799 [Kwoniella sp. CBS 9459]